VVRATLLIALAAVGIASAAPERSAAAARCSAQAVSYPWPVRPFAEAHSVRGSLNEPRGRSFHFGVDITARDGQRVFAVQTGRAYGAADRTKVTVVGANGCWIHRYWHVVPAVANGTRVRPGSFIGRVLRPDAHVHLAEWDVRRGRYIDPTRRRGGLSPYRDSTTPAIAGIAVKRRGEVLAPSNVRGVVNLVVRAHDLPALASPVPWAHFRVTPATIGWRLVTAAGRTVRAYRLAYDGRV
jgi:murein DD-endopeptidase MepM/ murein hydrolase activator NlpD